MSKHSGSHSAPRSSRAARPASSTPSSAVPRSKALVLALGITATLVAWGFLVFAAIDFGREARSGEPAAWWLLVLATVGAAACLFVTLILGTKVLDLLRPPSAPEEATPPPAPRPPGGRRAAR